MAAYKRGCTFSVVPRQHGLQHVCDGCCRTHCAMPANTTPALKTRGMWRMSKDFFASDITPVTLSWGCRSRVYRRSLRGNIRAKSSTG